MTAIWLLLVAFGTAFTLTPCVRHLARAIGVVDQPHPRKVHKTATPLLGGVSIAMAIGCTVLAAGVFGARFALTPLFDLSVVGPILMGAAVVFCTGLWDDVRPLPVWVKLLCQAAAAAVAIGYGIRVDHMSLFGGSGFDLGIWAIPVSFFWILGITNAFNLLDGLDGLVSGLGIIIAAANALFFYSLGEMPMMGFLLVLLGALLGFLPYNFNPATIFLGDSGSLVIGYILSVTAISGTQNSVTSLAVVIPLLLFGLPIVDTLLSMARRLVASVKLHRASSARLQDRLRCAGAMFEADRRHIHHRLLALGFSHRHAVLVLYGIALAMASLAMLSVLAQYRNAGVLLIAVGAATYVGVRRLGYDEIALLQTGTMLRWYEKTRLNRRLLRVLIHAMLVAFAYWGAFLLKYDHLDSTALYAWYRQTFPIHLAMQFLFFYLMGLHRGVWRTLGVRDLMSISGALLQANLLSYIVALLNVPPEGTLRFFLIDTLLLGALSLGVRSAYQVLSTLRSHAMSSGRETLICDAGPRGQSILRELQQNPDCGLRPIGFLDDNNALHGHTVDRIPILGSLADLRTIVDHYPVACLILPENQMNEGHIRSITGLCQGRNIAVLQGGLQLHRLGLTSYGKAS
jgi:UDP-GlcNAc:undecaprenyl-phosphate GlcNAc-1-phosphate transferase